MFSAKNLALVFLLLNHHIAVHIPYFSSLPNSFYYCHYFLEILKSKMQVKVSFVHQMCLKSKCTREVFPPTFNTQLKNRETVLSLSTSLL